ncbi:MAG: EAL domain-containing protein, partial [Oscillospiraceae bacterium]|nr:EAL domain-containing protein [Oscillospiraceae bacterium]
MGIFDFSRPDNYSKISEEWQIFESIFPDTGAFKYLSSRKEAYLDDNTYRILRVKKESEDGSMPEADFFRLLKKITVEPVYNKRHIYNYRCGNESFWIKLSMVEKNGQWIGFIKDMTSMMQEITFSESFSILNSVTKLNSREAFLEELRILSESKKIKQGYLATFHINGINHLNQILGIDNSKKCISCVARTVSHFMSDDIIIGSTPYYEFLVFFKDKTKEEAISLMKQIADAVHESKVTDDFGEALIPGSDARLSLNCGYCTYPDDSKDFNKLVNYSGFALYEILENTTGMINAFNRKSYEKEKEFFTDAQVFCKIIDENLFEYHLQPIVDARTGVVFGYEALMRTIGNKYLNPFQMLEIAKKQKRTYDIEKKTFFNVMKILHENIDMFKDKKLFIN